MKRVVLLLGPTASGKSAAAMSVLPDRSCELVSVDSCQVYKGLDIGSAKPSPHDQAKVPHHLIDICDPSEVFTVNDFILRAQMAINAIHARGSLPVLVGGTAMYAYRLINGISPIPSVSDQTRLKVSQMVESEGLYTLWEKLSDLFPRYQELLHPHDKQRVMRAYEVWLETGKPLYEFWSNLEKPSYEFESIVMIPEVRQSLLCAVQERLKVMISMGFIEEVAALRQRGDLSLSLPSMRSVGYRQVWEYLDGDLDRAELEEHIVRATMRYVKHQCTWLKKWPKDCWVKPSDAQNALRSKLNIL